MTNAPPLSDAELLDGFDAASLPNDAFHHREHIRVAWLYVKRHGLPGALDAFSAALKRFAEAKGQPTLYHQTITWAFLLLIGQRIADDPTADWAQFAARNADLLAWKPSVLDRYYRHDTLWSERARHGFVWPDQTGPLDSNTIS